MSTEAKSCRVIASNREKIERILLVALENEDAVAILCSKQDLDSLIYGLDTMPKSFREKEFLLSLRQLRQEAFR